MTPKEKAKQLVDKMRVEISSMASKYEAKQCALIAVDEIIKELERVLVEHTDYNFKSFEYWQEVRNEIEKL